MKYDSYVELQDWCNEHSYSVYTARNYCQKYHIPLEIKKDGRIRISMIRYGYLKALQKIFDDHQEFIEKRNGIYIKKSSVNTPSKDLQAQVEHWIKAFPFIPAAEIRRWIEPDFWPDTVPDCFKDIVEEEEMEEKAKCVQLN